MYSPVLLVLASLALSSGAPPAAQDDYPQRAPYKARREGRVLPLPMIEARVLPAMEGAQYLGPELDLEAGRYRLKFMRRGRVIWIDVDARTGLVIGRSRH